MFFTRIKNKTFRLYGVSMIQKIKVSVIIPSLNVFQYIQRCIDSVRNQTLKEIEIICIDAGSTDGTLEVIKSEAESDSRITLIQSEKKSYGYQVNLGISMANGKYISIVESDDQIESDMLEKLFVEAENKELDFIKSNYWAFSDGRKNKRKILESVNIYNKVISPKELPLLHFMDINIWTGIYRRQFLIDNHILLNESAGAAFQDIGFVTQALCYAERAEYLNEPFYIYTEKREGASTLNKKCFIYAYQEWKRIFENQIIPDEIFESHRKCIVTRLVGTVLPESKKVLISEDYNIDSPFYKEPCEWFSRLIKNEWEKNNILFSNLTRESLKDIWLFTYNQKSYSEKIKTENLLLQNIKEELNETLLNLKRPFVIFGSGQRGKRFLEEYAIPLGLKPLCFVDNDKAKCGSYIDEVPIVDPETSVEKYHDVVYFIANKKNYLDIEMQLLGYGVNSNNILIF